MKKEQENQYYKNKSFWLEVAETNLTTRPKLAESKTVDIAIMGGGFTGLWTAYYLLLKNPSLDIAIVEKEIVGFGASGRNGGWCYPRYPISPAVTIERYGIEAASRIQAEMLDAVTEIGRVIAEEGLDVDWKNGGGLQLALGEQGFPALENEMQAYVKMGLDDHFAILNESQTASRVKVQGAKRSLLSKNSAVLNPAKLVRQLAEVLEKKGVMIYEKTEIADFKEGTATKLPQLITKEGAVLTARSACVIAGEAYAGQLDKFRRRLIPMYSLITLTEPLTDEQWKTVGWEGRESVGSTRYSINYLQRTKDGRILFGGRGQPYRLGGKIKDSYDTHKKTYDHLQGMFREWFPSLSSYNSILAHKL